MAFIENNKTYSPTQNIGHPEEVLVRDSNRTKAEQLVAAVEQLDKVIEHIDSLISKIEGNQDKPEPCGIGIDRSTALINVLDNSPSQIFEIASILHDRIETIERALF